MIQIIGALIFGGVLGFLVGHTPDPRLIGLAKREANIKRVENLLAGKRLTFIETRDDAGNATGWGWQESDYGAVAAPYPAMNQIILGQWDIILKDRVN